jgi:hypothetical protein
MHDRVDVVVKCEYWPLVELNSQFVECNTDADASPMLRCYYKTSAVCLAGLGSLIGALLAVVPGILAGVAIAATIGCVATAVILCIIALIVALVIAAAIVLIGACLGGLDTMTTPPNPPTASDGTVLMVGDYVTTCGGLLTSTDDDGSRVYWFVDTTIQHGKSIGSAPFSHTDPDANLLQDGCGICLKISG